jgi:glucokinase
MKHVMAVDLGGTKTAIALIDDCGGIADKQKAPAASNFGATVEQILSRHTSSIAAVGVIVPGIYEATTGKAWAPNLWGSDFHPLRAELEQKLGVPVSISSDRTGSVLAEQWRGAARGLRDVLFVAVGTGIGVGILSGGEPLEGAHGIAGAAGWMVVGGPWKAEYSGCGGWETEAAGPSVARRCQMESAEAVVAAARAGNQKALQGLEQTADYLALGIANLIAIFDPEMVVLGGGLMQASELMLDRIRSHALAWTQPISARHVRIEKTALGEDAGLLGAARLAWLGADRHRSENVI